MKNPFNIVGIGEVLWDVFPDGPRFGGAPANMICAITDLSGKNAKVNMISAVGADQLGDDAIAYLANRQVNVGLIEKVNYPTGTVTVMLDGANQASYQFADNCAWDNLVWSSKLAETAASIDAVCFGSLAQRNAGSRETIHRFIQHVPKQALKVFDVNLRVPFYSTEVILQSLELANVLKLNEEELPIIAKVVGISGDNLELLQQLKQLYQLTTIAFTQGAQGAVLLHHDEVIEVPIVATTVIDTVGAGDSFTAALTLGLLKNKPLSEIGEFASLVSSYVCSQRGATPVLTHL
ncbi:carbohydrate kinase family protein [Thalassotalea castellviae]|uniref:Carbohydrate kinase n=1 Tax=Thalassotalea castellviae TaxID=3075612 RepID=A0ABU2ZVR6_9GAMM|nr:carbohydrate kinase [Thalassotalea sp. W431]MDT0602035.1 carbohydrate kinase [Thalassotalea sp. W431]